MTREEAIAELNVLHKRLSNPKDCEDGCFSWEDGWYVEAIDMAIEALSVANLKEEFESADAEFTDLPDIPRYYYEKVVGKMAHEINTLKGQLESADAVQGEWKHTITGQPYCSNCEYVFGEDEEFSPFWKYCPMCGARMENTK